MEPCKHIAMLMRSEKYHDHVKYACPECRLIVEFDAHKQRTVRPMGSPYHPYFPEVGYVQ